MRGVGRADGEEESVVSGPYTYTARVTALNGSVVDMTCAGSTAGCALTTLRRSRRGDWMRIEIGLGKGKQFVVFAEVSR